MSIFSKLLIIFITISAFTLLGCGTTSSKTPDSINQSQKQSAKVVNNEMMKLYFNNIQIPIKWENNNSVTELCENVKKQEILVSMKMARGNEQVGSLRKKYKNNDKYINAVSGDVLLYDSDKIVILYGTNSWYYTKLGKITLTNEELTNYLSKGDVVLKLSF